MSADPTTRDLFPATAWTVLQSARDPSLPMALRARDELCSLYWKPLWGYLRALGLGREDAEDGVQKILADFCKDELLARVDAAKGKLRHFFKAAARHAVANFFRDQQAVKRGGKKQLLALEEISPTEEPSLNAKADENFDREWAWTVFDRSLGVLRQSYVVRRKEALFEALRPLLISGEAVQLYREIGSTLGVGEAHVRIEMYRLRRRLAAHLRQEVAATLLAYATAAEIEAETRYLFRALAHAS